MVQPLSKPKIIKKFGNKKFNRHQHDRKIAVKVRRWALLRLPGPWQDRRPGVSAGDGVAAWAVCCCTGIYGLFAVNVTSAKGCEEECSTVSSSENVRRKSLQAIVIGGWEKGRRADLSHTARGADSLAVWMLMQPSWRRPKGIDSRVRRKFKGCGVIMPNIGYGSNKKTRHLLPSGELPWAALPQPRSALVSSPSAGLLHSLEPLFRVWCWASSIPTKCAAWNSKHLIACMHGCAAKLAP
jgi:ribosomal protein L32E